METAVGYLILCGAALAAAALATDALTRWRWRRRQLSLTMRHHLAYTRTASKGVRTALRHAAGHGGWSGWRKFQVARKTPESVDSASFYLRPHDGKPVVEPQPGQFLTFRLRAAAEETPLIRCYSLSALCSDDHQYRITAKRLPREESQLSQSASCYLHDQIEEGAILDVKQPAGEFVLDLATGRPLVFIAGGIGLMPFLAMAEHLEKHDPEREVWLFYGVINSDQEVMAERLRGWAARPNFHLIVRHSAPKRARGGAGGQRKGRIDIDLMRRSLPSSNYEFFICGPPGMMRAIVDGLRAWEVPARFIHLEKFGADTVHETSRDLAHLASCKVAFLSAGKQLRWTPKSGTILDLADASDVFVPSGCRAGSCGTCATPLMDGAVTYLSKPEFPVDKSICLVCVAVPDGDIRLA